MKAFQVIGFLVALAAFTPTAQAVDNVSGGDGKFAFGLQGGATFPDFRVTNNTVSNAFDGKTGWLAGAYLEFGVWTITLRPEFNYVQKGYTVANLAEVKNRYLEIPVLLKFNPIAAAGFSPFIVLGPQWSKRISSSTSAIGASTTFSDTTDTWDIAAVGGLGVEFNFSENVAFNIQGRYNYGFRDQDTGVGSIKSRGFYALAGLTFENAF